MRCEWKLHAPTGFRLAVNFMEVDVHSQDCFYDKVTVYDGIYFFFFHLPLRCIQTSAKAKISLDHCHHVQFFTYLSETDLKTRTFTERLKGRFKKGTWFRIDQNATLNDQSLISWPFFKPGGSSKICCVCVLRSICVLHFAFCVLKLCSQILCFFQ